MHSILSQLLFYSSRCSAAERSWLIFTRVKSTLPMSRHARCSVPLCRPITHSGTCVESPRCRWQPARAGRCREVRSVRSGRQLCCVGTHTSRGPAGQISRTGQGCCFFFVFFCFFEEEVDVLKLRLSAGLTFRRSVITFCANASCSPPILHTRFSTLDEVKPQVSVCK